MQRRLACLVVVTVLCAPMASAQHAVHTLVEDASLSLSTVTEDAFARHPEAATLAALEREVDAIGAVAANPMSGPAALSLRYQHDLPGEEVGVIEYEAGLQVPLKRFRESRVWHHLAAATEVLHRTSDEAMRWRVAGLVREALWDVALSRNAVRLAENLLEQTAGLAEAVDTRVSLGDLASMDALEARAQRLRAEARLVEARGSLADTARRYIALVGHNRMPRHFDEREPGEQTLGAAHPALRAAAARVERGSAEIELEGLRALGNPTVAIGPRWERGDQAAEFQDTFGLSLNLPFGGASYRRLAEARAAIGRGEARATEARVHRELDLALHEAQHELAVLRESRDLATERERIGQEHLRRVRIAFDAGESDLAAVLRAQGNAHDAASRSHRYALQSRRAVARLNQALGLLPSMTADAQTDTDDHEDDH